MNLRGSGGGDHLRERRGFGGYLFGGQAATRSGSLSSPGQARLLWPVSE
jgi:hypothetical protein